MQRSDTISALAKALAQAQGELQNPSKTTKNTFFNSKYADLAEVLNVVREVLPSFGLSIVQNPEFDVQTSILTMETILLHESGEWMSSSLRCPVPPQQARDGKVLPMGPQALGSATTYMRRYGVTAIVGIAQEDDDGESLSDKDRKGGHQQDDRRPAQTQQRPAQTEKPTAAAVNQDDKIRKPGLWPIEDQETFATLMDELYTAFKAAGKMDKYPAEAEKWRSRMANDTPDSVLPSLNTFVVRLKEAAAKAASVDPAAAPAA